MAELVPPAPLSAVHRWGLVAISVLVMALSFLDRQALAALAPTVCRDLGLSNEQYGWAGSAFAAAHAMAAPFAGVFLDRVGVRRGLLAAVVAWSLISAAHGLASGFASLLVLRALLGVAEAPSFPGSVQVVRSVLPGADVPRGVGYVWTGPTLGAVAALFVAVALERRYGWRSAFAGVAAVSIAWVALWVWLTSAGSAPDWLDAAQRESRASAAAVFSHRAVVRAAIFVLLLVPIAAFGLLWAPKFMVARYGVSQEEVARFGFLPPLAYDLGAIVFGDIAARAHRRGVAEPARLLIVVASLLAMAVGLMAAPAQPWTSVLLGSVAFFGVGGALAINTATALLAVPHGAVSRAGAMIAMANSISFIVCNPLIGRSVDATGSYRTVLAYLGVLPVAAAAAWVLLGRRSR